MRTRVSFFVVFGVVIGLLAPASAEIPQVITYQGKVTDSGGSPVADGDYTMTFDLYDASSSGTSLWSSGGLNVPVSGGVFSVLLGDTGQPTLNLDFDADYWLDIGIEGDIQSPRARLGSIGYAYMASGIVPETQVSGSSGYAMLEGINSGAGAGLRGYSDLGVGVRGICAATDGKGVYGTAVATEGSNYGVYGSSASSSGRGVYGTATATSGDAYGVHGVSSSTSGSGVYGSATATSGYSYGVYGEAVSGYGVFGYATALTGAFVGVYGRTSSTEGIGVYGYASQPTGTTFGVVGASSSPSGRGVYGKIYPTSGTSYAGYFTNPSTSGRGIYSEATATMGTNYGGYFTNPSTSGRGIYSEVTATTGTNYGIYSTTASTTGYAGYFEGRGYFSGNVGIGTESPDRALSVVGYVRGANAADETEYVEIYHGGGNGFINWEGDGSLDIRYANSPKVTVEQDGDVGIGTASPGATLDVRGGAIFNEEGGDHDFRVEGDTWDDLFCIDASANRVGIGTDTPITSLDVHAQTYNDVAIRGSAYAVDGIGVLGIATDGTAVYYSGGLAGTGSKSCVVRTSQGPTVLYCQESPENWFEDFGEGSFSNGSAAVPLDPLFSETVTIDGDHPMKVFIAPNENIGPWWIEKAVDRFSVRAPEARDGARFDYRVVAKRKGFEAKRLDYCKAAETDSYLYPELREKDMRELEEEQARMEHE